MPSLLQNKFRAKQNQRQAQSYAKTNKYSVQYASHRLSIISESSSEISEFVRHIKQSQTLNSHPSDEELSFDFNFSEITQKVESEIKFKSYSDITK